MKNVVLLGSTGSIGTSTVKVAEDLPDQIRLLGLAAGGNAELLLEQTRKHRPAVISINDPAKAKEMQNNLRSNKETFCWSGRASPGPPSFPSTIQPRRRNCKTRSA